MANFSALVLSRFSMQKKLHTVIHILQIFILVLLPLQSYNMITKYGTFICSCKSVCLSHSLNVIHYQVLHQSKFPILLIAAKFCLSHLYCGYVIFNQCMAVAPKTIQDMHICSYCEALMGSHIYSVQPCQPWMTFVSLGPFHCA